MMWLGICCSTCSVVLQLPPPLQGHHLSIKCKLLCGMQKWSRLWWCKESINKCTKVMHQTIWSCTSSIIHLYTVPLQEQLPKPFLSCIVICFFLYGHNCDERIWRNLRKNRFSFYHFTKYAQYVLLYTL
jgi:hypothetical protein